MRTAGYRVPARRHRHVEVVERSRFIATVAPAETRDEVALVLDEVRREMPDATHHVYGYRLGSPESAADVGMSDAGEPHGTAGRPVLNAILHSGVGDVVVVVTRYFGGRKLGRGGLVRAYGSVAAAALSAAETREKVEWRRAKVTLSYGDAEAARRVYGAWGARLDREEFGAAVIHHLSIPDPSLEGFSRDIGDRLGGRVEVEVERAEP